MDEMIQARQLTKLFGDVLAVDHISFEVHSGELFGFLGPNGAGKTTTIKMLTGLARPTSGTVLAGGVDVRDHPKRAQRLMGVVPDESNLYPELTGFENLTFCASLYGMRRDERRARARELLEMFNLSEAGGRKFETYSKGMKRKLTIAAGIIHQPPVLFLDEPTTGIDVASARQIRQLISNLHKGGTTIFLTTHYIEEAERLCDRIAFIVKGRIIRTDSVPALLQPIQDDHIMEISHSSVKDNFLPGAASEFPDYVFESLPGQVLRVTSRRPIAVSPIIQYLENRGSEVLEAKRIMPSLEEVFVKITGVEAADMENEKSKKGKKS